MSNEQTKILKEILDEVKIINTYLLNLRIERAGQQDIMSQSPQTLKRETEKTPEIDQKQEKKWEKYKQLYWKSLILPLRLCVLYCVLVCWLTHGKN